MLLLEQQLACHAKSMKNLTVATAVETIWRGCICMQTKCRGSRPTHSPSPTTVPINSWEQTAAPTPALPQGRTQMALVTWDQSYSVSVKKLDEQHQKLFSLLNTLHEAMRQGKGQA